MYTTKRGTSTQKSRFDNLYLVTALARCLGLGHKSSQFVVAVARLSLGVHPSLFVAFLGRKHCRFPPPPPPLFFSFG